MERPQAVSADKAPSNRPLWAFLILTCLLSWPIWFASGVLPRAGLGVYDVRWLLAQIGVFAPSLAALIVSGAMRRDLLRNNLRMLPILLLPLAVPGILVAMNEPSKVAELPVLPATLAVGVAAVVALFFSPLNRRLYVPGTGKRHDGPGLRWMTLSIVLFPALFVLAWLLENIQGGSWNVSTYQGSVAGFAWIVVVVFSHNFLLGGSLGEEVGWRGFLLPELLRRHPPLTASLYLAVIWGLWHLPIDLYAGILVKGPVAVLMRIVWMIPIAVLFTWFYVKSRGNLLVALCLHTSINILPDLGFSEYERSIFVMFLLMSAAAIIVAAKSRVFREG